MKGPLGNSILTKVDNNILHNNFNLTENGNELIFKYFQFPHFGLATTYHFFRTKNGFAFYSRINDGTIVEKNGNEISISYVLHGGTRQENPGRAKYFLKPQGFSFFDRQEKVKLPAADLFAGSF
jgi:predicted transcriptional regulator